MVNVPMWLRRWSEVMHEAGGKTSGAKGAACVEIDWRVERHQPQSTDLDPRSDGQSKDQRIATGHCWEPCCASIHDAFTSPAIGTAIPDQIRLIEAAVAAHTGKDRPPLCDRLQGAAV